NTGDNPAMKEVQVAGPVLDQRAPSDRGEDNEAAAKTVDGDGTRGTQRERIAGDRRACEARGPNLRRLCADVAVEGQDGVPETGVDKSPRQVEGPDSFREAVQVEQRLERSALREGYRFVDCDLVGLESA